jgi:hypothetical protein
VQIYLDKWDKKRPPAVLVYAMITATAATLLAVDI